MSVGTGAGLGVSARLARSVKKQPDGLPYAFNATSVALVSKLRQDGQLNTVENVMHAIEQVSTLLTSHVDGHTKEDILNMCQHLKVYGACLEVLCKEQLDRAFVVFRNSSQDEDKLDYQSRLHLLELIELRANQWKGTDLMTQYYKKKTHLENEGSLLPLSESASSSTFDSPTPTTTLGPGEVMKTSGKFSKPTRIPGKNYCKDEVVIRNADSGKVMGIKGRRVHMIEELSETIISFQRVTPGAKERLVQITGANESSINHAKHLIEDTIRRNASPVRELNAGLSGAGSNSSINSSASEDSGLLAATPVAGPHRHRPGVSAATLLHSLSTGDATVGEYKYTVVVKGHTIKITGHNLDLVRMSKLVLDEFFSGETVNGELYQLESFPQTHSPSVSSACFDLEAGEHQDDVDASTGQRPLARTKQPNIGVEGSRYVYSMDVLARMAMSPYCLAPPMDWTRISCEHPTITRKIVEVFDADRYLSNRNTVANVLCTSASDESLLSESSA